jgi:hypothetical protein
MKDLGVTPEQDAAAQAEVSKPAITEADLLPNPKAAGFQPEQPQAQMTPADMQVQQPSASEMLLGGMARSGSGVGAPSYMGGIMRDMKALEKEQAEALKQQAAVRETHMKQEQEMQQETQNLFKNAVGYAQEFANAAQIDPKKYWANAATGQKLAAGLAAAFSGFAQAYTGGRNVGLDTINNLVEQDIQAQVKNYEQAKNKAEVAQGLYANYAKMFGDTRAANLATRAAVMENVTQKLDLMKSRATVAAEAERIGIARAQLEQEKLKTMAALAKTVEENQGAKLMARKLTTPGAKVAFASPALQDPQLLASAIKDGKAKFAKVGDFELVTDDEVKNREVQNAATAFNLTMNTLDRMKQLRQGGVTDLQARTEFAALKKNLLTTIKSQQNLGALDNGVERLADGLMEGIEYNTILTDGDRNIEAFRRQANSQLGSLIKSVYAYGSTPQTQKEQQDERTSKYTKLSYGK